MASEALDKAGLHFDDLNRIRVLDEDSSSQAQELKEVCQDFLGDIGEFQVRESILLYFVSLPSLPLKNIEFTHDFRKLRTVSL